MKTTLQLTFFALVTVLVFSDCKKTTKEPEEPETPIYDVPTSYSFANADFSSSTQQIDMLGEITTYLRSTHTTTAASQPTLSAQKLKDMYNNTNNPFSNTTLNSSGINLKNKTSNTFSFRIDFEASFDEAQDASIVSAANPTVTTASNGVRGKLVSSTRAILVDGKGFEFKEYAEKGVMGAGFYSQATTLLSFISSFDNSRIDNGRTTQEKAWDEAFGYFGVPVAFPTNTVGLKYWGSYCNSVNVAIGSNATIMNAFLKGRAAISNKDDAGRDAAATIVVRTWEKVAGAKCISYLKAAKNNLSDKATLHHNLSEAYGFVVAFQYNPSKTISDADITTLLGLFGNNLYNLSTANIDLAISKLESAFGLNALLIP